MKRSSWLIAGVLMILSCLAGCSTAPGHGVAPGVPRLKAPPAAPPVTHSGSVFWTRMLCRPVWSI
jgi:hypothetical protein